MTNGSRVDVAIIGCGTTGLMLARLLEMEGLSVAVVDRTRIPIGFPRATHLDDETVRAFQTIGLQDLEKGFTPTAAYARGLKDLQVLANLIPADGYVHGPMPTSIDAGIYGFLANIYLYEIETPLKKFVISQPNLIRHCRAIHAAVG